MKIITLKRIVSQSNQRAMKDELKFFPNWPWDIGSNYKDFTVWGLNLDIQAI
jgi:hypothetical protein